MVEEERHGAAPEKITMRLMSKVTKGLYLWPRSAEKSSQPEIRSGMLNRHSVLRAELAI